MSLFAFLLRGISIASLWQAAFMLFAWLGLLGFAAFLVYYLFPPDGPEM